MLTDTETQDHVITFKPQPTKSLYTETTFVLSLYIRSPFPLKKRGRWLPLNFDDGGGQWDASAIHPTAGAWRAG